MSHADFADSQEEYDDPVTLSALQHYCYCPRQCALIYVEQIFDENTFTMKGRWAHTRVDEEHIRSIDNREVMTALPVWSDRFGLVGKCDVVELRNGEPRPVEFKHGRRAAKIWDEVQLCGQAICLEEMFDVSIPEGDIYHISSRRRRPVQFSEELRAYTIRTAQAVREMLREGVVPPAVHDAKCFDCSLQEACMPQRTDGRHHIGWKELLMEMGDESVWAN